MDLSLHRLKGHREVGLLHLSLKHLLHGLSIVSRAVNIDVEVGDVRRGKERESLDMVPVGVAEEDGEVSPLLRLTEQLIAQVSNPCAGVKDQPLVTGHGR